MSKFLIVGLGNIGPEYEDTRHNIGFRILDRLAAANQVKFSARRLADVAELKYKGRQLVLIKPSTFMNLSGKAVNYWLQAENIDISHMMVVVDELALPFGKIRIGPKGSDGGHNGLKSIQEVLGTAQYPRLRFGIGSAYAKGKQVDYVLGKWGEEEKTSLDEKIDKAVEAITSFTFAGLEISMNQYNK
ncbi:MAG TPA: aminoacyl-tRNA hydrolase [Bacteroidia bacterium]|nr:aminoacyl-tRNA hydrolase [Bacteroidia bacterium]